MSVPPTDAEVLEADFWQWVEIRRPTPGRIWI